MATSPPRRKLVRPRTDTAVMPENLTTRVTEAIRQSIVDAEFKLGQALSETSLATRLGVSRTPVREALTTLQRQGLIVIRPQSGSFVFMPSEEDVAELCEFRRLIETAALRLAYVRRRVHALAQMREAIATMELAHAADDALAYARADAAFHQAIVENSANRYLIESYSLVSGCVGALRSRNLSSSTPLRRRSNTEHRAIVTALEKGELPEAEQLIDEHLSQLAIGFRGLLRDLHPEDRSQAARRSKMPAKRPARVLPLELLCCLETPTRSGSSRLRATRLATSASAASPMAGGR
jgi:DNA-binding GntR family transcriptional regulator